MTERDTRTAEFQAGFEAAIRIAREWHEGRAKQALALAKRTRFPKNLERDAEVHRFSAEMMSTLSADDV